MRAAPWGHLLGYTASHSLRSFSLWWHFQQRTAKINRQPTRPPAISRGPNARNLRENCQKFEILRERRIEQNKLKNANDGLITKPVTTMGNWSVSPWVYSRKESKIYIRIISPQGTRQLESLYTNSHQLLVECCCQECYFPVLLICCAWAKQLWRSEKVSGKRCKCWLEVWCVHRKEKGQRDTVRTLTLKDRWKA